MTRINLVPPSELTDKHLLAEYRELPRVFGLVHRKLVKHKPIDKIPPSYRMGEGHVKFFYDKLGFVEERLISLVAEMKSRGFKPSFSGRMREFYPTIPAHLWNYWSPPEYAVETSRERIEERLFKKEENNE